MLFLFWILSLLGWRESTAVQTIEDKIVIQSTTGETYACVNTDSGSNTIDFTGTGSIQSGNNSGDYDFETDTSLQKYVSPDISLNDIAYVPPDMVSLSGFEYIEIRNNEGKLRKEAASALAELAQAFHESFGRSLVVVSSYRGYAYQKKLLAGYEASMGKVKADMLSAKPGHSEHQLGLAVDVFNTEAGGSGMQTYFAWLRAHGHEFGWTQSYQKGRTIDGYIVEPWHWRYVGKELARELWEKKMTLGQYVGK